MVFTKRLREGIRRGRIRCSIRIWTQPHVKVGGRYRMDDGQIEVDSIEPMSITNITYDLARESGFDTAADLLETAKHGRGDQVYLIRFTTPGVWGGQSRLTRAYAPRRGKRHTSMWARAALSFLGRRRHSLRSPPSARWKILLSRGSPSSGRYPRCSHGLRPARRSDCRPRTYYLTITMGLLLWLARLARRGTAAYLLLMGGAFQCRRKKGDIKTRSVR